MGAPTSSIFSENTEIYNIVLKHNIEGYFRYVDDILIIYNINKSNINNVLDGFNKLMPKLKFNIEKYRPQNKLCRHNHL